MKKGRRVKLGVLSTGLNRRRYMPIEIDLVQLN